MIFLKNIDHYLGRSIFFALTIVLFLASSLEIFAQDPPPPPRPVVVTITQNLGFGAFTQGMTGGTLTINSAGSRSSTGDVILLNMAIPFTSAGFKLVANGGTLISLLIDPTGYTLTRSLGGGTMTFHIADTNPVSPFVIPDDPPAFTMLYIGGTLTVSVPASNPAGDYSGTFDITFMQE